MSGGRYQAYPAYKNSADEWLGPLPCHWGEVPVKHIARIDNSGSYGADEGVDKIDLPVATTAQIGSDGRFHVGRMPVRSFSEADILRYGCNLNDILIVKSSGSAENIISGKAGIVDEQTPKFVYSNFLMRLVPDTTKVVPQFLYSLIVSELTRERVKRMVSATTYPNLRVDEYVGACLPIPPLSEQTQIAAFLDHETAKIDRLIEKQQELISLLKEKRQAVISHAVTKGLNPRAPLKDSGIEWLGQVPAHWKISKFGYISSVVRGGSPRPAGDPTLFNGDYSPWVTVAEITKDDEVYLTQTETFLTKKGSDQCRVFASGTLVLSNSGATLGVPKILRIDANANDGVVGFEKLTLNHEYAYHYLSTLTDDIRERVKQGSGQPNLNTDIVKTIAVPIPPPGEAEKIVEEIDRLRQQFKDLVNQATAGIALLQERRTALISAAVTGKIDVRHWQPPVRSKMELSTAAAG